MSGVQYSATFRHGPVSGPINGFLGAVVVTLIGRVWNKLWHEFDWFAQTFPQFPVYIPLFIAALGVFAAVAVGLRNRTDQKNIMFRSACWAVAGIWSTVTMYIGWSWIGIGILAGGAVLAGLLAPGFGTYEPPPAFQYAPGSMNFDDELLSYIVRLCNLKPHERPTLRKVETWDRNGGYTYKIEGARGSTFTWHKLRLIQQDLAAALQLDDGCPVQAEKAGTHQGAALLQIATKNFMKEPVDYPLDFTPLSIKNEFSVGRFLDGSPTLIELYQAAGLAAGQRGGGKTVLLQSMTASLARCVDVIVWHVDLNGGGMSSPWTTPYAEKKLDYPIVDWVATTPRDALRMAKVALRIAKDRKKYYQRLLIQEGVDVLPVRPDLPLIMILVDESAEVTGETAAKEAKAVSAALQEVQRIGRAMCVNVFFSTQRATAEYLPAQLKKGASVAFCTRVKDESELAYVFDWHKGIHPEDLVEPGQMFIQRATGAVRMFKGYRLLPPLMVQIAHGVQPIRARVKLDARAVKMGGAIYASRWETDDTKDFLSGLRGDDDDDGGFYDEDDLEQEITEEAEAAAGLNSDTVTGFNSTIAALRAQTQAAIAQQQAQQPPQQAPTAPATPQQAPQQAPQQPPSIPVEDQNAFLTALDALQTTEPVRPKPNEPAFGPDPGPPPPAAAFATPGPHGRRAFIVQFIEAAGEVGRKTAEVIAAVQAAGFPINREQTVKEDLKYLRETERLVTQHRGGEPVFGMWWDRDYG